MTLSRANFGYRYVTALIVPGIVGAVIFGPHHSPEITVRDTISSARDVSLVLGLVLALWRWCWDWF